MSATISGAKITQPSASRNCEPISLGLLQQLDVAGAANQKLLEVASGCGQHAGYLAPLFPTLTFQPTEVDSSQFASIRAYAADCPSKNILEPMQVDISQDVRSDERFAANTYDYMFNSNMMHISPWSCSQGLFRAAGYLLKPGGRLFTYGPYAVDGTLEPESNVQFDRSLKSRNPEWGVRDIKDLKVLAAENGLALTNNMPMPSNNKLLTWLKS